MELIGLIKWFDKEKNFGVVGIPGEEYFLHMNSFKTKPEKLLKGTPIIFEPKFDKDRKKNSAINSRLIEKKEDFELIMQWINKSDLVQIEIEVTGRGKAGNPYRRRETNSYSISENSTNHFSKLINQDDLINSFKDYFSNKLKEKCFIRFCEICDKGISKLPHDEQKKLRDDLFIFFGSQLTESLLFICWKAKRLEFIGKKENDYEIPEEILKENIQEISVSELPRIKNYSYSLSFLKTYTNEKLSIIDNLPIADLRDLYKLIEFADENDKNTLKVKLDEQLYSFTKTAIEKSHADFGVISNEESLRKYTALKDLIPRELNADQKEALNKCINAIIENHSTLEYKPNLWLKGIIKMISFDIAKELFYEINSTRETKAKVLAKLSMDNQLILMKEYSNQEGRIKAYELLEILLKNENNLGYYFKISEYINDNNYWQDKKHGELLLKFIEHVSATASEEELFDLFTKGLSNQIPRYLVDERIPILTKAECEKICGTLEKGDDLSYRILIAKVEHKENDQLDWVVNLAKSYLLENQFEKFDLTLFSVLPKEKYYAFWVEGDVKIFPYEQVDLLLNHEFYSYSKIENWLRNHIVTDSKINDFLFERLNNTVEITDRVDFYRIYNTIQYLSKKDVNNISKISGLKNDFYSIILWSNNDIEDFSFDTLKGKFIYFSPEDQSKIFKKLFSKIALKENNLSLESLSELLVIDLDLYKINRKFNPDIPLDISTHLIIEILTRFKKEGKFLAETDILSVVLKNLVRNRKHKFKFTYYFEKCLGREVAEFNWKTNGEIIKTTQNGGDSIFTIKFEYDASLVEKVKALAGRRYDANQQAWTLPATSESSVLEFAKTNRFFLNLGGSNYKSNPHLAVFNRAEVPNGITFCEARPSNKVHQTFSKEFWWCCGQPCFGKCEFEHKTSEWINYTLLDFCKILGLNTDETNRVGDHIPNGNYYNFISLMNRFNRLLDKLYCQECDELLSPVDTSNFAAHTVVRFCCENSNCGSHKKEVYLNHCLNGQCNAIIDSRTSKKCPNGLFICDSCGSCCSHDMLNRRLTNLRSTGGYIHQNLVLEVEDKLGHLERAEYYCYKCANQMIETNQDVFECKSCNEKYDTVKYKFKRLHRGLGKTKPKKQEKSNDDNLPF